MFETIFISALFLILIASAVIGFFRGFIKSIAGLVTYIVSFFVAKAFTPFLAKWMIKVPFIANMITPEVETPEFEGSFVNQIIQMVSYAAKAFTTESGSEVNLIAKNYLAQVIANVISFIALFIVCAILLHLVFMLLNRIAKIEGFKEINRLLGLIIGIVVGLFIVWIIVSIFVNIALPLLAPQYPDVINENIKDNVIIKIFAQYNPIALIMNLINNI